MFHFPRCRPPARGRRDRPAGLPHSETHGSRAACASPWNIAACRVLLRHPLPRHPSCARKACPQKTYPRPRLRTFFDAPAGSRAPSGRGLPLLHSYVTFKVFLSFASGCQRAPPPRRAAGGNYGMVGAPGLEPGTSSLSEKRSNQLSYAPAGTWWSRRDSNPRHPACKAGALPAELRPPRRAPAPRESSGAIRDGHRPRPEHRRASLIKGGDPAAGSPTATLLRLHPSHRPYLRRLPPSRVGPAPSGMVGSHDVTGGVYKARERIQGAVADAPLLAIPASCSRVAGCNPNWGGLSRFAGPRGPAALCTRHCSTFAAPGVGAIRT